MIPRSGMLTRLALRVGVSAAATGTAIWLTYRYLPEVDRSQGGGSASRIPAEEFCGEYRGHTLDHLKKLHDALRGKDGTRPIIWLAGDSSLDNKHWLLDVPRVPAVGGLEDVIDPPLCTPDIAHQLSTECLRRGLPYAVINTAVEESTLGQRSCGLNLLPQDLFLRDHLRADDIIIVSVGGNDVALRPTPQTAVAMMALTWLPSRDAVAGGTARGMEHLRRLYTRDAAAFIREITSRCSPAPGALSPAPGDLPPTPVCVALCTIYFPDQRAENSSWAGNVLYLLGYDSNPGHLQEIIRAIHVQGVSHVVLPPPQRVVPVPLFAVLDGRDSSDYVARVEPSAQGGAKLARLLLESVGEFLVDDTTEEPKK